MKAYSKWMKGTLALMLALLLLCAGAVVAIDPFFHYHARLPGLAYPFNLENYQNPGIVQHFRYDSLLTGSSVTMEFKPSLFKTLMGTEMVKVPHSDASPLTLRHTLQLALEANPGLETVYYGMDHWALARNPQRLSTPLPEYLYDQNPFNDTAYALNKDVLFGNTAGVIENTLAGGGYDDFDTAYTQDYNFVCGESISVARYREIEQPQSEAAAASLDIGLMLENTRLNLEQNFLPMVAAHPGTRFVVFFPPGSILYWYDILAYKSLDAAFEQLNMAFDALLAQPNVEVYFFMGVEDIVCNLYNYFDWIHYGPDIHEYMTRSFAEGRHRLTAENREYTLNGLRAMVETFDFDALFGTTAVPAKGQELMYDYFAELNDKRYRVFIASQAEGPLGMDAELAETLGQIGLGTFGEVAAQSADAADTVAQLTHYIALMMPGGSAAGEQYSLSPLNTSGAIVAGMESLTYRITSAQGGDLASIEIGGVEYAQQLPGYNVVVWDSEQARVVDSVAFSLDNQPVAQRRTSARP